MVNVGITGSMRRLLEGNTWKLKAKGRIQDFHLGGGGGKRLCARMHIPSGKPGVQLLGLFFLVLSEPYILSILIQNGGGGGKPTVTVDENFRGDATVAPPPPPSKATTGQCIIERK